MDPFVPDPSMRMKTKILIRVTRAWKKRHGGHGGRGRHGGAGKDDIRRLGASNAMQVVAVNSSAPIAGAAVVAGLILVAYRRAAKKKYPSEDEIDPREIE
jgi:hypothetical protein